MVLGCSLMGIRCGCGLASIHRHRRSIAVGWRPERWAMGVQRLLCWPMGMGRRSGV